MLNLGTGTGSSVLEVLAATSKTAGELVPYDVAARRPGDAVATYADPSLAHAAFGWVPKHGLAEIADTAYRWHLSQYLAGASG